MGSRSTSLFGLWGIVLLAFGLVAYAVTPAASAYVLVHVGLGILLLVLYLTASRENLTQLPRRALDQVRRQRRRLLADLSRRAGRRELPRGAPQPPLRPDQAERLLALDAVVGRARQARQAGRGARLRRGRRRPDHRGPARQLQERVQQLQLPHGRPGEGPRPRRALQGHRAARRCTSSTASQTRRPSPATSARRRSPTACIKATRHHQEGGLLPRRPRRGRIPRTATRAAPRALQDALRNENYETRKVLLATEANVPAECSILVVAATERPLFDHELDAAPRVPEGRTLGALPGAAAARPAARRRPAALGREAHRHGRRRSGGAPLPGSGARPADPRLHLRHASRSPRTSHERTVFPMARAVQADAAGKPGVSAIEIVKSSPSAWARERRRGRVQARRGGAGRRGRQGPRVARGRRHRQAQGDGLRQGRRDQARRGRRRRLRHQPVLRPALQPRPRAQHDGLARRRGAADLDPAARHLRRRARSSRPTRAAASSTSRCSSCPSCCSSSASPCGGAGARSEAAEHSPPPARPRSRSAATSTGSSCPSQKREAEAKKLVDAQEGRGHRRSRSTYPDHTIALEKNDRRPLAADQAGRRRRRRSGRQQHADRDRRGRRVAHARRRRRQARVVRPRAARGDGHADAQGRQAVPGAQGRQDDAGRLRRRISRRATIPRSTSAPWPSRAP